MFREWTPHFGNSLNKVNYNRFIIIRSVKEAKDCVKDSGDVLLGNDEDDTG